MTANATGDPEDALSRPRDPFHRYENVSSRKKPTDGISTIGNTVWRTLVPRSSLTHIPDVTSGTSWWYVKGGHAYFSGVDDSSEIPLEDQLFELSVRSYHEPDIPGRTVSWGIPATNERVQARFVVRMRRRYRGQQRR